MFDQSVLPAIRHFGDIWFSEPVTWTLRGIGVVLCVLLAIWYWKKVHKRK